MNKDVLRKVFLEKRLSLSEDEWTRRNDMLFNQFVRGVSLDNIKVFHSFLPIIKKREPDTWRLIEFLQMEHPEIKVAVSRTLWKEKIMENYLLDKRERMVVNGLGIPEPVAGKKIDDKSIDMVVVPLIIFDKQGNRLGYGKGFYDTFFNNCRPDVIKAGLSLGTPLDFIPYMERHDIKLDCCVTPFGVWDFRENIVNS